MKLKVIETTLERLPRQVELYNKIFDTLTLVCSQRLVSKAKEKIPEWWGIQIPLNDNNVPFGVRFEKERDPQPNENVDLRSLVKLTWKNEAISSRNSIKQILIHINVKYWYRQQLLLICYLEKNYCWMTNTTGRVIKINHGKVQIKRGTSSPIIVYSCIKTIFVSNHPQDEI